MFKWLFLGFIVAFAFGWLLNSFVAEPKMVPFSFGNARDLKSPFDHIKEEQIHVYDDVVVLDIKNASWASFANTKSMDPLLDGEANGIEIKPKSIDDIHVGDVVSYKPTFTDGLVIHRIVETGFDENGWYAITKGDNNNVEDPEKIRFEQINGILVAIVY